ncbi:MAG: hypothetical protein JWM19_2807 [Actinomycetia bacterium]|nr:hypothetical protein [Actinomycetes bacterium]
MGFSGTFIVVRSDQPVTGLPALAPLGGECELQGQRANGWQVAEISHGSVVSLSDPRLELTSLPGRGEATLRALMEQTGNPVIATTLCDSDAGHVVGYSPAGRFGGWLHWELAVEYYGGVIPWDEDGNSIEDDPGYQARLQEAANGLEARYGPAGAAAAPPALAWAGEAGLRPDAEAVAAVLEAKYVFAEETFFRLIAALGVPELNGPGV